MEDFLGRRKNRNMVAGASSVRRAIIRDQVERVLAAKDADSKVTGPVIDLASKKGLKVEWVSSMRELGESVGLRVGSSVAALLRKPL